MTHTHARVLVVDDEEVIRLVLNTALSMVGYEVHEATSGTEGLEKARALMPHLIITDITMPGLNGYELVDEVRRTPGLTHVPVMVLTAKRSDEFDARSAAVDAYLTKPFSLNDLYESVRGLVSRSSDDALP